MARVLIVGCGCRGLALAGELLRDGHAVRGTTRDPSRRAELEAAGVEPYVGDPDRVGSLVYALEGVTVLCWLLGSAAGPAEAVAALHGPRLAMLFEKSVDTTVRGVVYETAGTVDAGVLAGGAAIARRARETWEIPIAFLSADPDDAAAWTAATRDAVEGLLAAGRRGSVR